MAIFYFVLGLLLFIGLVLFHEWGHYIMARRGGVDVEEFGLGFPPQAKVLAKRKGTVFSLNWLPLGGFVKLKGEHDQDTEKGTFGAAPLMTKVKIMLAGVAMNLLAALVLFTAVAAIGMPKILCEQQFTVPSDTKVIRKPTNEGVIKLENIAAGSPAEKAGLKADDQLVSVAGVPIRCEDTVSKVTKQYAGQTVPVQVMRGNELIASEATLNNEHPYLGIEQRSIQEGMEIRRSTWSAPIVAVGVSKDFVIATMKGLGSALSGLGSIIAGTTTGNEEARTNGANKASDQVSGPVGIFYVLYLISQEGVGLVLFIIAIISLTLAIMNALPIPALDGGRLFVTLLFRGLKKPLRPEVEERIHATGFAVLMVLIILVTIVDIRRF